MNFVLNDLGLAANREKLVDILNQNVPHITNDVVVIYIQVVGYQQGVLKAETYCRKIYGDEKVTAIQKTTACGICAVVEHWATNDWSESEPHLFFSEDISQGDLIGNPFWKIYE
jgi:saccharopine dehydrogenase-like NADP-dependent oxidoreductase